jgi:hypothetical protein
MKPMKNPQPINMPWAPKGLNKEQRQKAYDERLAEWLKRKELRYKKPTERDK